MRASCLLSVTLLLAFPAYSQDSNPATLPKEICVLNGNENIVPNILGFSPVEAQKAIENCGFVYDGATDVHTLSYEAIGTVGDQEPSGGKLAASGSVVRGFVSVGLYPPDFTGWTFDEANSFYRNFRHGVNREDVRNSAPIGTVFDQFPKNAELANSGPAIKLYVSLGLFVDLPEHAPRVIGMDFNDAKRHLESLGLVVVHGGGYFDWTSKQITNCEWKYTFPKVTSMSPDNRVYEGDTISLMTEQGNDYELFPVGSDGKDCQ